MAWLLACAAFALLMQAGLACLGSGIVRGKNSINLAVSQALGLGLGALAFWSFGFALFTGNTGWFGADGFMSNVFLQSPAKSSAFLQQLVLAGIPVALVLGAGAERLRFAPQALLAVAFAGVISPIFSRWVAGGGGRGWLDTSGYVDLAGASGVHALGAWAALAAIMVLGARRGRFDESGRPQAISESQLQWSVLGLLIFWLACMGFNAVRLGGQTERLPLVLANTLLAGSAGMATVLSIGWLREARVRVQPLLHGTIAGLVGISATAHVVGCAAAVFIGTVAALLMLMVRRLLLRARLDDATGSVAAHLAPAIWAVLAVAALGHPELINSGLNRAGQWAVQAKVAVVCGLFAFASTYAMLRLIGLFTPLRASPEEEEAGLNISIHEVRGDLHDLFHTMDQHVKTGDLSLRARVEPFSESGMIAKHYNQVMSSLERAMQENKSLLDRRLQLESETASLSVMNRNLAAEIDHREKAVLERERLMVEAISSARLASIGELAAGVAHEINNPLNGMINYTQLVMDRLKGKEQDLLGEIINEGKRIASIVKNLLDFSRQKEESQTHVAFDLMLQKSLQLLDSRLRRSSIQVRIDIPPDLPSIFCRSREVQQVLINVITNAEHALNLRYPGAHKNKLILFSAANRPETGMVELHITDHGQGIAPEHMENIFRPFFTTKDAEKGTGLGLSICRKIVERHQGRMEIRSSLGQETDVMIVLPVA